jgi:hypothetical protein
MAGTAIFNWGRTDIQYGQRFEPGGNDLSRECNLVLALCAFSMVTGAQETPLAWFPLQTGTRWVYEHEWRSGDPRRPDVDRWTTEETITGTVTTSEGLMVLREVKEQDKLTEKTNPILVITPTGQMRELQQGKHAGFIARERKPYLIHGNCIYVIEDGWDSQSQRLRPSYRKYLAEGAVSPDFCFPLQMGRKWGTKDIPWRVESPRNGVGSFLPREYAGATHIFSGHFGSGGLEDVWFQRGIGIVGEHYLHDGTYDEYTRKLVSFSR